MTKERIQLNTSLSLGTAIKDLRKKRKYSLVHLAEQSGISKTYLWQLEQGNNNPTIEVLVNIANALDCSVSFLLGEEKINQVESYQQQLNLPFPANVFQLVWETLQVASDEKSKGIVTEQITNACHSAYQEISSETDSMKFLGSGLKENPHDNLILTAFIFLVAIRFSQPIPIQEIVVPIKHKKQFRPPYLDKALNSFSLRLPSENQEHYDGNIPRELSSLINKGQHENAILHLTSYLESNQGMTSPGYRTLLYGLKEEARGQEHIAIPAYENSLKLLGDRNPVIIGFLNLSLARLYSKLDQILAINHFETALNLLNPFIENTERVTLYTEIGWLHYRTSKYSKAINYFQRAIDIIEKEMDKSSLILTAYRGLGAIFSNQGKIEQAIKYLEEGLDVSEGARNIIEVFWIKYRLAVTLVLEGLWDNALALLDGVAQELEELGIYNNPDLSSQIYNQIGHIKKLQGHFASALSYHQKAHELQTLVITEKGSTGYAFISRHFGDVYLHMGNYDQALYNLIEAIEQFAKLKISYQKPLNYSLLSEVMAQMGAVESGLRFAKKALEYAQNVSNKFQEAIAHKALGQVYIITNNWEEALVHLDRAMKIFEENKTIYHCANTQKMLSVVMGNLGNKEEASRLWYTSQELYEKLGIEKKI